MREGIVGGWTNELGLSKGLSVGVVQAFAPILLVFVDSGIIELILSRRPDLGVELLLVCIPRMSGVPCVLLLVWCAEGARILPLVLLILCIVCEHVLLGELVPLVVVVVV